MYNERAYKHLKSELQIDQLRLDQDLIEHPARLMTVTEYAADALQLRDTAKHTLDITDADAAQRIRNSAEDKISEAKIAALLPLDEHVQNARQSLDEANHDVGLWQGLVRAYQEKGSAMKRIAELTIAGFLAPNAAYSARKEELHAGRRAIIRKPS